MASGARDHQEPAARTQPGGDSAALRELRRRAREAATLTGEELERLLQASARGDRASQETVVGANLALVLRLAETRVDQGLPLLDLVQEGSLGLLQAVRGFAASDSQGDFASYAEREVARQMDDAIAAEAAAARDAQLLVQAATDYERTELLLRRELKRPPTEHDLAEKLEWSLERTRYVARVVADAKLRHDEELLAYIDPESIDLDGGGRGELDDA